MPPKKPKSQKRLKYAGALLIIALLSVAFYLLQTRNTENQNKEYLDIQTNFIALNTPTSFAPPLSNRPFWGNPKIQALIPPQSLPVNIERETTVKLTEQLKTATLQVCIYQSSEWEARALEIIEILNSFAWYHHSTQTKEEREKKGVALDENQLETASTLATSLFLLKPKIPQNTFENIQKNFNTHMLNPYLAALDLQNLTTLPHGSHIFAWTDDPSYKMIVYTSHILIASFALNPPNINERLTQKTLPLFEHYMTRIEIDGYFPDGIRYWAAEVTSLSLCADLLLKASFEKVNLYSHPKFAPLALYPYKTLVYPNTSQLLDNSSRFPTHGENSYEATAFILKNILLTNTVHQKQLQNLPTTPKPKLNPLSLTETLLLFHNLPEKKEKIALPTLSNPTFFPSSGFLLTKSKNQEFALTVTPNARQKKDHRLHKHGDTGSYTLYHLGTPIAGELGTTSTDFTWHDCPTTCRGFCQQTAQENPLFNSFFHPVPIVNYLLQNQESKGKILSTQFSEEIDTLQIDLTDAYPEPSLLSLKRTLSFKKTNPPELTILDEFESKKPINFQTNFLETPEKKVKSLRLDGSHPIETNKTPLTETTERLTISLKQPTSKGWIKQTIIPKTPTEINLNTSPTLLINLPNQSLEKKLTPLIIPTVQFKDANLENITKYLEEETKKIDGNPKVTRRGINIRLNTNPEQKLSLSGENIPILQILNQIASAKKLSLKIEGYPNKPLATLEDLTPKRQTEKTNP